MGRNMKIAIGLSGGVDSCMAAWLLKRDGHDIVGITMKMGREGLGQQDMSCCAGPLEPKNIEAAGLVAKRLGIEYRVIDVSEIWHKLVLDRFISDYRSGLTPNPCVVCNAEVKFAAFLEAAKSSGLSFDAFATGHYARIIRDENGQCHLLTGLDSSKDQSYFLSRLTQSQLSTTLFPLGELHKKDIIAMAREAGFDETAAREESQDFAGETGYDALFDESDEQPGPVIDTTGKVLGTHRGIIHYTVGQRKNLGIATGEKVYVKSIDPASRTVVLGKREEVMSDSCIMNAPVWISGNEPSDGFQCHVKLRYRHPGIAATLQKDNNGIWSAHFATPQFAVAPGQAAVAYVGDEVIGSAWIGAKSK